MVNLDDVAGYSALKILEKYTGKNPYIKTLKIEYSKNRRIKLTDRQRKYIVDNHQVVPSHINRVINITSYLGEQLKRDNGLTITPERILIEYMLADEEKTFHIFGKLTKNQERSKMYFIPKTQVMDDPYFEEIDVEVDFDKYQKVDKFELSDGTIGRTPFEHQKDGVKFLLSRNGCILADDMGLGKAIANDIPVLTPNGWVPHGTLKVGDFVIGSNGLKTEVLGVYPQQLKDYYNITLTDGTIVESCDEHLWCVQTTNGENGNNSFTVKPLRELMGDLTYGSKGDLKWYLPMVKPIEFNKREIGLDPYLLGCSLSDGEMGHTSSIKFIPDDYKYNTKEVRLEILQGLLDTDGYCGKDGTIQFNSTSERLSNDVKELVQSFGGVGEQTSKIGKYKKPDGTIVECELCHFLTINLPKDITPFKLQCKIDSMKIDREYPPSRGIKSIEFSRTTEGQCISVNAEDNLYVMDQYVVTHNTYMAVIAALETGVENILVVCPSSVKLNWQREITYLCDESDTTVVTGKKWDKSKFTIINYDILKNFHTLSGKDVKNVKQELVNSKFDLVIIDEAHYLKNYKSNRGKIMSDLCVTHGIERVWLLTGTPIANRPMDFYNLLKLIKSPVSDNWKFYVQRYCEGRTFNKRLKNGQTKQIWLTDGASNLEELNIKTKNNILRRKKVDVLDMPEKTVTPLYQRLSKEGWVEYDRLWDEYLIERTAKKKKGTPDKDLVELGLLRKFIAMEAIPNTIEMVENMLEYDEKVIIFTTYTEELLTLQEHFGKDCVIHHGGMNQTKKQKSVDDFQNNPKKKVFIGNVISAGVGITLTEATNVVFNSFDWVTGNNDQAEDRAWRIGQRNNVSVYYQLFEGTVSIRMWNTLNGKRKIINKIIGDKDIR